MAGPWPLVGREPELALIDEVLRGSEQGLLLGGPAGVGKSRLVAEAIARAADPRHRPPWHTVHLRAVAAPASPFGLFAPVAGDLAASGTAAVADALRAISPRVLLAVDDVHLVDAASAAALFAVVADGVAALVGSLRSGEPVPPPVQALWKDDLVRRIELAPLPDSACEMLLDAELGEPVETVTRRTLVQACAGNPLYLRELVRGSVETGALALDRGVWRLVQRLRPSARLVELVETRLGALDPAAREVLALIVLAEPCPLAWLEPGTERERAEEMERRGILAALGDEPAVAASHPVVAEVVRSSITRLERRRLSALLVERAAARPAGDRSRELLWRLDAGLPANRAALLAAARRARRAGIFPLALRFARAAARDPADPQSAQVLAEVLEVVGEHAEAERVLGAAVPSTEHERAQITMARANVLFRGLNRREEAAALTRLLRDSLDDPMLRDEAAAQLAVFRFYEGDVDGAVELALPLVHGEPSRVLCEATTTMSMACRFRGRFEEAAQMSLTAARARHEALADEPHSTPAFIHYYAHLLALAEAGHIDEAISKGVTAYEDMARRRHQEAIAWYATALAHAYLAAGRIQTAERYAREAAVLYDSVNHGGVLWGFASIALARAWRSDGTGAADALADHDARAERVSALAEGNIRRARAWHLAAGGDLAGARAVLRRDAQEYMERGLLGREVVALHDLARLGDAIAVAERLRVVAPAVSGPLAPLLLAHAEALAAGNPYELEEAATDFAALGARLLAAEAANEAAVAFAADGEPRCAAAARRRAEQHASASEGARTPALAHGAPTARLTRREREIARRAASGVPAKEIAAELGVSHRTVETHLQNAYDKLGVASRSELADLLDSAALRSDGDAPT